ncbi:hypothetical protein [Candidatus Electronema sp. PJ]|uniref:hypothetical protein n=1 Tax=Candidatus Electronema sp. PJ TaxID=3401572 RepID=UPI003AA9C2BD
MKREGLFVFGHEEIKFFYFLIKLIKQECYSLSKKFGLAKEEFCRVTKELYSATKESGRLPKKFCRVGKEF